MPTSHIDLRSDTVTLPTPTMRQAMATAEVGDDVYGEDPTINALEELAATTAGKDAALFVPSGAMGNTAAILTHCRRGDAIVVGSLAHIYIYEVGGAARLNGSPYLPVPNLPDGTLDPAALASCLGMGEDIHESHVGLLCVEDTQNMCGGRVLSVAQLRDYAALAARHGMPMHLDGARAFNAAAALGISLAELVAPATSVMFCLSKGLCAPVGSMLAGSQDFIAEARRVRKLLGGGMRQAGILAAAGIVALREMVDRLPEDHALARRLADHLGNIPGIAIDPTVVETNILFFSLADASRDVADFTAALAREGVLMSGFPDGRIRAVTHYGITADAIDRAAAAIARSLVA